MGLFDSIGDAIGGAFDWIGDNTGSILGGASIIGDWITGSAAEKAAKKQGDRQAAEIERVAQANREISLRDAEVARRMGLQAKFEADAKAGIMYNDLNKLLATQRTRYAKSGVAISAGSPVNVMEQTLIEGGRDIMNVKYGGDTAKARADSLSERYELLADKGLRDAAAQASLIEEAANDRAQALEWDKITGITEKFYNLGMEWGWF